MATAEMLPDVEPRRHQAIPAAIEALRPVPDLLPPANGAPAVARAGGIVAAAEAAPDVAMRAKMSVGLQQHIGNARIGALVAKETSAKDAPEKEVPAKEAPAGAKAAPAEVKETPAEAKTAKSPVEAPAEKEKEKKSAAPATKKSEGGEKAAPPSPRQAIAPAVRAVHERSARARKRGDEGKLVGSAQAAAKDPKLEATREASVATVKKLDDAKTAKVRREKFKSDLSAAIKAATPEPQTKEQADKVMKTGGKTASNALKGSLATEREAAAGSMKGAAATEVAPAPGGTRAEMESDSVGPKPAPVSAAPIVPAPLPPERLDYSSDRESTDKAMEESGVSTEQLSKGNEPQFNKTLSERSAAEKHEATAEAKYRKSETVIQAQTKVGAQGELAEELGGIHGSRDLHVGQVTTQQNATKTKDAQERERVTNTINGFKNDTRIAVGEILAKMETDAASIFETGLARAEKAYEDTFEEEKGGIGTWLTTWGDDWEELIERSLRKARDEYFRQVDLAIDDVADLVDTKLEEAKTRVTAGRQQVDDFVNTLEGKVKDFGVEALKGVTADFDAMESEIDQRRDALIDKLAQQYKASYERMSAKEEALREANKSFWQRVYDATVGVIKKILAFKDMLVSILAKAAEVVVDIISDPIGFLGNLVSAVMRGLENFMGNIATHLEKGLMEWLFGALAGAGLQMPEKFDLQGIISIILQVLGLTYANFRARAVAIVGEPIVDALEKTAEVFKILMTQGVSGLWDFIKEKVLDLKSMVMDAIMDYIKERVIIAGVTWIIGLLNPASAFFKACKAIYDIVMFFINRGSQILALINAIIDSIAAIAKGQLDTAIKWVENALAKAIPVAIGFLAALLGLGDISGTIRKTIDKAQEPVNKAIDWVIGMAVKGVKAVGKLLAGKPEEKKETPKETAPTDDLTHDAKVAAGLAAIDRAEKEQSKDQRIAKKDAEAIAATVKKNHPVFTSLTVVDGEDVWNYDYTASPGEIHTGPKKEEKAPDKPANYDEIMKLGLVGMDVAAFSPPPPAGYSKYKREDKWFIRRVEDDDTKYQRLGVDLEEKIILGKGVSEAEALRSESEMRKELGPAEEGKERHHLIPLSVCAKHDLVKESMSRGEPAYGPNSGLIFLPKDAEAAKKMPGLPIHSGSHPKWSAMVSELLDAELIDLLELHKTIGLISPSALTLAVKRVQNKLMIDVRTWKVME